MKAELRTWLNLLLSAVIGFMGFSCANHNEYIPSPLYGAPYTDFTFEGQVKNEKNEALEKIQIVINSGYGEDVNIEWSDTLYTNTDGIFYKYYQDIVAFEYHQIIANDPSGVYVSDTISSLATNTGGDGYINKKEEHLTADFILKEK